MTAVMDIRKISRGETRFVDNIGFTYFPGYIEVFDPSQVIDVIELGKGEVTTTQHFEEKIMWWMYEYNRI